MLQAGRTRRITAMHSAEPGVNSPAQTNRETYYLQDITITNPAQATITLYSQVR